MGDSILNSIKKLLGLDESYEAFDQDVIIHINTYLGVLYQLGIGTKDFYIEDSSATWADFLGESQVSLYEVKTWVYLNVRMVFDTPTSSIMAQAMKEQIAELTWRLNVKAEYGNL